MTSIPIRLSTNFMTFIPSLTFTRIMSGFHGAFATGVASQQGTLTLPDTWFRPPFWDLLMLQLLRPNSSNLPCLYSTFHLEYPLVLSRFCMIIKRSFLLSNFGLVSLFEAAGDDVCCGGPTVSGSKSEAIETRDGCDGLLQLPSILAN